MPPLANRTDKLLMKLDGLLDQAVSVVPRPRDNFSAAIRAMRDGRYDAATNRFRRLEVHETLARDITLSGRCRGARALVQFLKRVSVRLHAG